MHSDREQLFPIHKKKKRYAHQVFGNVGNFQIAYSDGIVVLTHIAWAAITTSVCKGSYDLRIKKWHCSSRFCILITCPVGLMGKEKRYGTKILSKLRYAANKRNPSVRIPMAHSMKIIASTATRMASLRRI